MCGAVPLARQSTDVRELISATCSALRSTDRSPSTDIEMPDDPVVVDVDPDTVRRVLENLLTNAAKHSPPGSAVTVTLSRHGATPSMPSAASEDTQTSFGFDESWTALESRPVASPLYPTATAEIRRTGS